MYRAMTVRSAAMSLALSALLLSPVSAQITKAEYASRRDSVAARIGNGVVIAFGAREPVDDMAYYRQLPNFNYLTGVNDADAAFMMVARDGKPASAILFLPPKDPRMALYTGFLPTPQQVRDRHGLELRTMDRLRPTLDSMRARGLNLWNVPDVASRDYLSDPLTRSRQFYQQLGPSDVQPRSAHALLDSLRVRKSPAEIANLRRAIDITMEGFTAAMRVIAPGKSEAVVQAEADRVFRSLGEGPSYGGIVGSGPNSTSYHYRANNRTMRDGEVVVMDIGALYNGYAADVTRTVPVNGRFTADQRAIYDIVLNAQKAAEKVSLAGDPVSRGDSAVRAVEAEGLARLGLIESPNATFDPPWATSCAPNQLNCKQAYLYMAHGLGHGIGLEVHDVGGYSYSATGRFQVGEVFTIEPGIYISTQLLDMLPDTPKNRAFIARVRPVVERFNNIGIRIEDDYLVTANGLERLSIGPREATEIEAVMQGRGR